MAHHIDILDRANAPEEGLIPALSSTAYETWDEVKAALPALYAEHGPFTVNPRPDHQLFENLGDYIAALNSSRDWLDAHPEPGAFISGVTDDLEYWASLGVRTPTDLYEWWG